MKYYVCNWEDNGYHDSYFYGAHWDAEKKELVTHGEGATAYAGGWSRPDYPPISGAPKDVYDEFREYCISRAAKIIHNVTELDIKEPDIVKQGESLIVSRKVKSRKFGTIHEGTKGRVFWHGAFGQFYRNGYNRLGRNNTRVGLETGEGVRFFIALNACSRDEKIESVRSIEYRLNRDWEAKQFSVKGLVPCKAWLSESFIY